MIEKDSDHGNPMLRYLKVLTCNTKRSVVQGVEVNCLASPLLVVRKMG